MRGFVIGEDVAAQAKALAAVFERAGPHNFVHPIYGPRQVIQAPGSTPEITLSEALAIVPLILYTLFLLAGARYSHDLEGRGGS